MRSSIRLVLALVIGIALVSIVSAGFQVRDERRALRADLVHRAATLAESLGRTVEALMKTGSSDELSEIVKKLGHRQGLLGVAIYDVNGKLVAATFGLTEQMPKPPAAIVRSTQLDAEQSQFTKLNSSSVHLYAVPLHRAGSVSGALVVIDDASFIDARIARILRAALKRLLVETVIVAAVALVMVWLSVVRPIRRAAAWLRAQREAAGNPPEHLPEGEFIQPLSEEVQRVARSLAVARASAEEEARLRETSESHWTAERLRAHVRARLGESPLFVVSNREPYMHLRGANGPQTIVPASGLVTAIEPVLLACDGTWIAQGAGDADRETVDEHDHLRVPPDDPQYTLRRVWLSPEEEQRYYYGFSNEGLWPLCHIAHTRPTFREEDWRAYQQVNERFAHAALEEMAGTREPCVLVQDYHFALLPRLIKQARPDARVAIFWHIPWPNPQAFGICPWQAELLDGLLGADLVGFHVQSHCNYFLETVDAALESRVDWEHFAVTRRGQRTLVRPFPISVHVPEPGPAPVNGVPRERAAIFLGLGVQASLLGVGVDRVDYTKGILERLRGVERLLTKHPTYVGRFCLVQIGAPSRTRIARYSQLLGEVEAEVARINARFASGKWRPIVLMKRHHSHAEIARYYRVSDVCLVTSLHDGMNLVAKEYVASRDDERGVLVLSQFTGAARELHDALLVNPYDTEQLADALAAALQMSPEEQRERMRRMRRTVREHNIYRWAANLIRELAEIRLRAPSAATTPAGEKVPVAVNRASGVHAG